MTIPAVDSARLIVGAVVAALVMAGLSWAVLEFNALRATAARVPGLEQAVADAKATIDLQRKGAEQANKVSHGLQTDLATIRADRDRLRDLPARVVRVYVPVAPRVGHGPAAAGRPGPAAAAPVELAGEARSGDGLGRDIGTDLYRIVDDADQREAELGAQVTRLQQSYAVGRQACGAQP